MGYLFILAIKILLLRLVASLDISPWQSKGKQAHLLEGYADGLSLYLKWFRSKGANINQIYAVLKILELFKTLSGRAVDVTKISKTYFGRTKRLHYLEGAIQLKYVEKFKLLNIYFHPILERMEENYVKALNKAGSELFPWARKHFLLPARSIM